MVNSVFYDNKKYNVKEEDVSEITFLGFSTNKATIVKDDSPFEVFWNSLTWSWESMDKINEYEKRFKNKVKDVYFNDKLYIVPKPRLGSHYSESKQETVQIANLPIGIVVYWDEESETWKFYSE